MEFETEKRILNIMFDKKYDFSREDRRKVNYAFNHLMVLEKNRSKSELKLRKRDFILCKEEYNEKMQWINDFMKSKGYDEDVFTNLDSFEESLDDYDYYYEYKTPSQYKADEEARKAKKLAKTPRKEDDEKEI